MDKNFTRQAVQRPEKSQNKDVSVKQFPKNRRRENQNNPKNQQDQARAKQTPKYKSFNDKRPQSRRTNGTGSSDSSQASSAGLEDPEFEAELHSVFVQDSKKQNLNHLLNFHYYNPRDNLQPASLGFNNNRAHSKKYRYNKEQYLQANCEFIVKANGDYRALKLSPDVLVEWDKIEQVIVNSGNDENICPICLYPPKAAKICRCGHQYCFSCMLHYLALSDKTWRKCPICYEAIHLKDLKSAVSKQNHSFKIGDIITFNLMRREKGSLYVSKASSEQPAANFHEFPVFGDSTEKLKHSKLILAGSGEVLSILEREKRELEFQMIENGEDCPESIFVQQAMDLVVAKEQEILTDLKVEGNSNSADEIEGAVASSPVLNPAATEFVPSINKNVEAEDELSLFDEDCNLTLHDIDIATCPSKYFYYYQSSDGQNMFLHSVNSRMLQQMYGSLEKSPHTINGKIVQIESCSMNEDLRKRIKYLQHLPVTTQFEIVEIQFEENVVSHSVWNSFRDELQHRRKIREKRERDEMKRERQINALNDRKIGKILTRSANIDIESTSHFPACGGFDGNLEEMPELSVAVENSDLRSPGPSTQSKKKKKAAAAGPSFATMLTSPTAGKAETLWPSLSNPPAQSVSGNSYSYSTAMLSNPRTTSQSLDLDLYKSEGEEDELEESKIPARTSLGDALANALSAVNLNHGSGTSQDAKQGGKKKKGKKTVLYASGMSFGGM